MFIIIATGMVQLGRDKTENFIRNLPTTIFMICHMLETNIVINFFLDHIPRIVLTAHEWLLIEDMIRCSHLLNYTYLDPFSTTSMKYWGAVRWTTAVLTYAKLLGYLNFAIEELQKHVRSVKSILLTWR